MRNRIIATIVGFITTFSANTVIAMTIIGPMFNARLGISRNPEKDGLNFPAILGGYLSITIFMVWLTIALKGKTWLQKGLTVGTTTALSANISSYLIVAGWSVADGWSMFFSAVFDSFATIIGALVITFILRKSEQQ